MTPDLELSAKEVSNLRIQWRGRSTSPAEYTHPTGTGKSELVNDLCSVPRALLGDWLGAWLGDKELSRGYVNNNNKNNESYKKECEHAC